MIETDNPATGIDTSQISNTATNFVKWLDCYGEESYDHQSYYASAYGRFAKRFYYKWPKLGVLAVVPMVLSEAFIPSARRLFWKKQRLPIADAHYAMGFGFLAQVRNSDKYYRRAVHFLETLLATKSPGYKYLGWGYPFDWETRIGTLKAGIPLITTVPYAYEAFRLVHQIGKEQRWLDTMRSVAEHALTDYGDIAQSKNGAACSYTPLRNEHGAVINASAYRACMLMMAARDLSDTRYEDAAQPNLHFVLDTQNADGSWNYSTDDRDFVDHFHTCFVLKALAKIERMTGDGECTRAIDRGVEYYVKNLFDEEGRPKPFSRRPRMTVYRQELYDTAECINLAVLLRGRYPALDEALAKAVDLREWLKPDGSFRSRRLIVGWDNVPMHRWAQSQMFRSLSFLLHETQMSGSASGD